MGAEVKGEKANMNNSKALGERKQVTVEQDEQGTVILYCFRKGVIC